MTCLRRTRYILLLFLVSLTAHWATIGEYVTPIGKFFHDNDRYVSQFSTMVTASGPPYIVLWVA